MSEQLQRNKQTAIAFYDLMFNLGKPAEAVRKYVGHTYIQHNPGGADGKEAFIRFFKEMAKDCPNKRVHVKRAIAEGQYVVLHCQQEYPASPTGRAWTSSDSTSMARSSSTRTFLQVIPKELALGNTMLCRDA
jgi:predicted SnoaL-like aldol condensation-catalyzing enzyme